MDLSANSTHQAGQSSVDRSTSAISESVIVCITAILAAVPLFILGPAIGWPDSLGRPAAEQLTAILAEPTAVNTGYSIYLLYSILILPVMVMIARRVFGSLTDPLAQIVIAFAALSALSRCIGILRWLVVMPDLAMAHGIAAPEQQVVVELVFTATTLFGGGVGELLGVSLYMGLSLGLVMLVAFFRRTLPRWLSLTGLATALLLLSLFAPVSGLPLDVSNALVVTALSLWMLVYGIWLVMTRSRDARHPSGQ